MIAARADRGLFPAAQALGSRRKLGKGSSRQIGLPFQAGEPLRFGIHSKFPYLVHPSPERMVELLPDSYAGRNKIPLTPK